MTEKENRDIVSEIKKTYTISEFIQNRIETALHYIFFWESHDKTLGIIIQLMHHAFVYGIILWYVYLHTFSDSYLQYLLFCFIFFLVWIQHLFCGACLFFNIEQKLIGDHPYIIDNILHIFHITPTKDVSNGVLLLVSSLIMTMLAFELLSRTIVGIKHWL
jgi:hypothetical protein